MTQELPKGWELTDIGTITSITTGKLDANAEDKDGAYPFFTCGEETLRINQHAFDIEAVLLAGNGNFGVKYYSGRFNAYQRTYVIEPKEVLGKWLYYCVSFLVFKIIKGARGSTIKYFRLGDITDCSVHLPPLNEQKRIVDKIEELFSELDKGIESLKTAREQLKIYRQAILKHAFEGKLTHKWRKDNKDKLPTADQLLNEIKTEREKASKTRGISRQKTPKKFDSEDFSWLSDLPKEWKWERLGWITTGVEYGTSAKSSKTGKVPVIRMGNIQNSKLDWNDLVFTSDKEEIEKYNLKAGDVLFNRTNSPEWVGKTALYKGERPAIFAGYLIRLNQIDKIVSNQFLNLYLNSHTAKQYGNRVKTDGVNQSNINGEKLINYPFPHCTLDEQKVILKIIEEKISSIDKVEEEIEYQLKKSEALRQSILKQAFSGKLVAQDPADEPASILLERIKAEKQKETKKRKAA